MEHQTDTGLPRLKEALFIGGAVLLAIPVFLLLVWVVGGLFDGITEHRTELDRCRKNAATPYEYHKC